MVITNYENLVAYIKSQDTTNVVRVDVSYSLFRTLLKEKQDKFKNIQTEKEYNFITPKQTKLFLQIKRFDKQLQIFQLTERNDLSPTNYIFNDSIEFYNWWDKEGGEVLPLRTFVILTVLRPV